LVSHTGTVKKPNNKKHKTPLSIYSGYSDGTIKAPKLHKESSNNNNHNYNDDNDDTTTAV